MIVGTKEKRPAAVTDYDIDYSPWLRDGETILSAVGTVVCTSTPADVALVLVGITTTTSAIRARISGGTAGQNYLVTITVTTTSGQIDPDEFFVKVRNAV